MQHNFEIGGGRGMAFDSPSHARNGVFMTPNGSMITRKDWGQMKRKIAYDEASGPKKPFNPLASKARSDVDSAVQELCSSLGLEPGDVAGAIDDILSEAERKSVQEYAQSLGGPQGEGAGSLDEDLEGKGEIDDDAVTERVREILAGMRWDDEKIEAALAKRREEAVTDSRPEPGTRGGRGGRFSGASKSSDDHGRYPGVSNVLDEADFGVTTADPYGEPLSARREREADEVRREGERIGARLPSRGVSRRLTGDAALCFDAELEALIANVKVGAFG